MEGMIEAGSSAEEIIHVIDLFTTFSLLANAKDGIPRDRIIDGVDQSGVFLLGDSNGSRDYVYIYEGSELKSLVKNKYKIHHAPLEQILLLHPFLISITIQEKVALLMPLKMPMGRWSVCWYGKATPCYEEKVP